MAHVSQYAPHAFVPETDNNSWSNMFGFIPDGSRVLDVGCSTGNFAEAMQVYKSCDVVGVDLNVADIAIARTKIGAAHVLDIQDPAAQSQLGRFDVVVFGDVIEHLPDPRAVLRAVHALLAPGGRVVYSIPNMAHVSIRLNLLDGRFPYTQIGLLDHTHFHFYDRGEVTDVFENSGYRIVDELPTVAAYPQRWVTERLRGIGLTPDQTFFDMLAATESHVFQWVGTAVPHGDAPRAPRPATEELMPQEEVLRRTNELIVRNDLLEN